MNPSGLTGAEAAALSSLNYVPEAPAPTALRLVYSKTDVEELVHAIARTRRDLRSALGVSAELANKQTATAAAIAELQTLEQRHVLRLNQHIDRLSERI